MARKNEEEEGDKRKRKKGEEATVILVDTMLEATRACKCLSGYKVLAMDLEGAPLKERACLLQLACSPDEIYVFDVMTLGRELFDAAHLLPLLTNPLIIKLCWDGRADGVALCRQFGVYLKGAYDMQIVYTSLFQEPSDGMLKGLDRAVSSLKTVDCKTARAFSARKRAFKRQWSRYANNHELNPLLCRPLAREVLEYAAGDIAHLLGMYDAWSTHFMTGHVIASSQKRFGLYLYHDYYRQQHYDSPPQPGHLVDFAPVRVKRGSFLVDAAR